MKRLVLFLVLCASLFTACEPDPVTNPQEKSPLIGHFFWESTFEYEEPYCPGEYTWAYQWIIFLADSSMIYSSNNDKYEFPEVGVYVTLMSYKEFSCSITDTTLTLSYLPEKSYRDNMGFGHEGDKLPPLVTSTFEYTTKYTIIDDTLVLWNFTHDGTNYRTIKLNRYYDKD